MFKRQLLSRAATFTATHGITNAKKDYLSIIKDQGQAGLSWAYALTSAIETNYALKTGNRLMLDPTMLKNNSVPWWKKQSKKIREENAMCLSYGTNGDYNPICAVNYMLNSHDSMIQQDGEDSFLEITDGYTAYIKTLQHLYQYLDQHGVLYSGICASHLYNWKVQSYIDTDKDITNAVVITAVGHLKNAGDDNGVYVEVLNSWGYNSGNDGLFYIKVADSETSPLINNMNILGVNIWVEVSRTLTTEDVAIACSIIFGILFLFTAIALGIYIFLYCRIHKKILRFEENTDPQSLNA